MKNNLRLRLLLIFSFLYFSLNAQVTDLAETFNNTELPTGWDTQIDGAGVVNKWGISLSSNAGSSANELISNFQSVSYGINRVITPAINTVGLSSLNLSFKHFFDTYNSGGITLRVQSSTNKTTWTNESWSVLSGISNIGPESVFTTVLNNLNSPTTYLAFVIEGNLYNYDQWFIDDVYTYSDLSPSTIDIKSPKKGSFWTQDNKYEISWMSLNVSELVYIEYSTDGGDNWETIAKEIATINGNNSFSWTIPEINTTLKESIVRVINFSKTVADTSEVFSLSNVPQFTFESPSASSSWMAGQTYNIVINNEGPATYMDGSILLSYDGGVNFTNNVLYVDTLKSGVNKLPIEFDLFAEGSAASKLAFSPFDGNDSKYFESSIFETQDAPNGIYITQPTSDSYWQSGTSQNIYWKNKNVFQDISIDYSLDGGSSWINYINLVGEYGTYYQPFDVPIVAEKKNALIRIHTADFSFNAISNPFIISPDPQFTFIKPSLSDEFTASQTFTIEISNNGNPVNDLDIYLSLDAGTNYYYFLKSINVPSGISQHEWTIDNTYVTTEARLTLYNEILNVLYTESDIFEILPAPPTIWINHPWGGLYLQSGRQAYIEWETNTALTVNLQYSTNGGTSWTNAVTGISSSVGINSYYWTIPTISGMNTNSKIRIVSADGVTSGITQVLTLSGLPQVSIEKPTLNAEWGVGLNYNIEIKNNGPFAGLSGFIVLSTDGGLNYNTYLIPVDKLNPGINYFIWNTAGVPISNNCKLAFIPDWGFDPNWQFFDESEIFKMKNAIPVSSITISSQGNATSISTEGGTLQMFASVLPSNASKQDVFWTVTDISGRATINQSGLLTAYLNGTVQVNAIATDKSGVSSSFNVSITNQIENPEDKNIIKEGAFPNNGPISGYWSTWSSNGGTAEVIGGAAQMVTAKIGETWELQLTQDGWTGITNGSSYTLSFLAWSDVNRSMQLSIEDLANNYERLGSSSNPGNNGGRTDWVISLTPTQTLYTLNLTIDNEKFNSINRISFTSSAEFGRVYIDDVSLVNDIFSPSNIQITSPSSGQVWQSGTNHLIEWNSESILQNVSLQFSLNGGSSWTNIQTIYPQNGYNSYLWNVASVAGLAENVLIRLITADAGQSALSNPFKILGNSGTAGIAAPNNTEICSGQSASLTLIGSTGAIQWQESTDGLVGWTNVTGGTGGNTAAYTTANLTSTKYYRAKVTDNSVSNVVKVTTAKTVADAGDISGEGKVCKNLGTYTYTVPEIANASSYNWTLPNGATGTSTTNSIDISFGATYITGVIEVKGSNTCFSGNTSILIVSANPSPLSAGAITGTTSVCQGQDSVTYTVPAITNATSYLWTLPNGDGDTTLTNTIMVNYGTSAVSGSISVKGKNSCGSGIASSLPITINQLPANAGTITGIKTVCQGVNAIDYAVPSIARADSYSWTLPSGATGTSAINIISVNYGSTAVSGNILCKGVNACGSGGEGVLAVTVNPLPANAGKITGEDTICKDQDSVVYKATTIANAASYVWTLPTGATGTSSVDSIIVNFSSTFTSGTISVAGQNSCGVGSSAILNISVLDEPELADTISGPSAVCQGETKITFTVPEIKNATSYLWLLPEDVTGTSSSNSIDLDFSTTAVSGFVEVAGQNRCYTGLSSIKGITVNKVPGNAGPISGVATVCPGTASVLYGVANIANATSYIWTLPGGVSGTSTTKQIFVSYSDTALSGAIMVRGHNSCDGLASSLDVTVTRPFEDENVCIITIDEETGKNMVVWEKTKEASIVSYNVYRESNAAGVYTLLANLTADQLSVYVDMGSEPESKSQKYRISTIDDCGNESEPSKWHRPMLLTSSVGTGASTVNLAWTEYQEEGGTTGSSLFKSYIIYRSTSANNLVPIDTIPSDNTLYPDNKAPKGVDLYYRIAGLKEDPCDPADLLGKKASSGPFVHSLSNLEDNRLQSTGIVNPIADAMQLAIYPSPFIHESTISYQLENPSKIKVEVFNAVGEKIRVLLDENQSSGYHKVMMNASDVNFTR